MGKGEVLGFLITCRTLYPRAYQFSPVRHRPWFSEVYRCSCVITPCGKKASLVGGATTEPPPPPTVSTVTPLPQPGDLCASDKLKTWPRRQSIAPRRQSRPIEGRRARLIERGAYGLRRGHDGERKGGAVGLWSSPLEVADRGAGGEGGTMPQDRK